MEVAMAIIGRKEERRQLDDYYYSGNGQSGGIDNAISPLWLDNADYPGMSFFRTWSINA